MPLRWGNASWTRNTGPRTLTSTDLAKPASVNAPTGSARALAALFITTSMPPNRSTAAATSARTSSSDPMWQGTPIASAPAATRASAVSAQASALRLATTTLAPAAGEPLGHRPPDPPRPTRDDGNPAVEAEQLVNVHAHPLSLPPP